MDSAKLMQVSFSWDIHWKCNYRCPYCWWHGRWDSLAVHNYYPGSDRLLAIWERIHRQYGSVHVDISGGEPMIYPQFADFLSRVTRLHYFGINTNLSVDVDELPGKIEKKDTVRFNTTFHPLFADFDEFVKKLIFLEKHAFSVGVSYLAWPGQIEDIPAYREKFQEKGFRLSVLTFWGKYSGKDYPSSYTEREKEIISPNLGRRSGEDFQIKPVITEGKLCRAGSSYATVHPDGKALRCGGGSWEREDSPLGNIFDSEFRLLDEPTPCTSRYCPCNEWAFLLVKDEQ
jgi:MoaA/NifB/PqqE/SkfB family radical SAM enzyme